MVFVNLPSLHQLSINTLYPEELLRQLNNEEQRYEKRIASEDEIARRRGRSTNKRFWYEQLLGIQSDIEIVKEFSSRDFNDVALCTAANLKSCIKMAVLQSSTLSTQSTLPIHDYITSQGLSINLDNEQSRRVTQEYQAYVQTHINSPVIELWTREETEESFQRGFRSAPHKIFDYYMLKNVGIRSGAVQNFHMDDPLATGGEPLWDEIRALYELVIGAPRAPFHLQLFRTVRNKDRLPQKWFKNWVGREMVPGDSVIVPTFLSTTLHDENKNWEMFGYGSSQADEDDGRVEEKCCIMQILLSKGVPMLPLGDFESNAHAHEDEVLLPPGIELVLVNVSELELEEEVVSAYTYLARLVEK